MIIDSSLSKWGSGLLKEQGAGEVRYEGEEKERKKYISCHLISVEVSKVLRLNQQW